MTDARSLGREPDKLNWRYRKRLEFIEFRLLWEGRVNRASLRDAFEISEQQASLELARYQALAPGNLVYDLTAKAYLRGPSFVPRLINGLTDRFLLQLMAVQSGQIPQSETYFGSVLPSKVAALPHEPTPWQVIMGISRAIRQKKKIKVNYGSLSSSSKLVRVIAPHALGYGSGRWHVRSWIEDRNEFRDLALDRIEVLEDVGASPVDPNWDRLWHEDFALRLAPNPNLDEGERKRVEKHYGMRRGYLTCSMSIALSFYLISDYNLDLIEKLRWGDGLGNTVPPRRIHLCLDNIQEYRAAEREARRQTATLLQGNKT